MKKKVFKVLQVSLSVLILSSIFLFFDIDGFQEILKNINISLTIAVLIVLFLISSMISRAFRWAYLMNTDKIKVSLWNSFKFMLVGSALNVIMPAGAGDVAKSYFGYKWSGMKERMLSVSLFDKLVAIASLVILAFFAFIYTQNVSILLAGIASTFPLLLVINYNRLVKISFINKIILFFECKIKRISVKEITDNLKFENKKTWSALLLSVLAWLLTYALLFLCFKIYNLDIHWQKVLAMSPILTLARLFPLTLNGLGSDELLMVYLFGGSASANEIVLVGALTYRLILILLPALLGLIVMNFTSSLKINKLHEP